MKLSRRFSRFRWATCAAVVAVCLVSAARGQLPSFHVNDNALSAGAYTDCWARSGSRYDEDQDPQSGSVTGVASLNVFSSSDAYVEGHEEWLDGMPSYFPPSEAHVEALAACSSSIPGQTSDLLDASVALEAGIVFSHSGDAGSSATANSQATVGFNFGPGTVGVVDVNLSCFFETSSSGTADAELFDLTTGRTVFRALPTSSDPGLHTSIALTASHDYQFKLNAECNQQGQLSLSANLDVVQHTLGGGGSGSASDPFMPWAAAVGDEWTFEEVVIVDQGPGIDEPMFFDPAFATGYEFALRPTDAPIVSVELPDLGDGLYDIHIRDAAGDLVLLQENASAETRIDLGQAVRWLFIDGLEESAEVPLGDQAAFVTGLYFDEPGTVNLTMQPIPEPATLGLLAIGGLALLRRRR